MFLDDRAGSATPRLAHPRPHPRPARPPIPTPARRSPPRTSPDPAGDGPADDSALDPTSSPSGEPSSSEDPTPDPGNREAAKYRTRLRAAEAENTQLRAALETWQRRAVETLAARHLAHPADLLTLGGGTLADYLDHEGQPDADKITTTARALLAQRPGLGLTPGRFHADKIGNPRPQSGGTTQWTDVLRR